MENTAVDENKVVEDVYNFAANQLVHGNKSGPEVAAMLVQQGLDKEK